MSDRNKTFLIFLIFSLFLSFPINSLSQISEPSGITQNNDNSDNDIFRNILHKLGFTGIGLDALADFRDGYDMGIGASLRFPRNFYYSSETSTSFLFIGTSNDSLDLNIVGIEQSLIFSRSHHKPFIGLMGLTAGYYFTSENHSAAKRKIDDEYFNVFLVLGGKVDFRTKSIITRLKYGMRKDFNEIHILLGMNFYE